MTDKGQLKTLIGYGVFLSALCLGKEWQPVLTVSNQQRVRKRTEGQNKAMDQLSQLVFDLWWPQHTETAFITHPPNSYAIAHALGALFQNKIIDYGGTKVIPSFSLSVNKMAKNQYHNFLPTPHHTSIIPLWVTPQIFDPFSTSWQLPNTQGKTEHQTTKLVLTEGQVGKRGCREASNRLKLEKQLLPVWEVHGQMLVKSGEVSISNWEVPKWRKSGSSRLVKYVWIIFFTLGGRREGGGERGYDGGRRLSLLFHH